ncbi:MAG: PorV/PorQ family protein [Elusimicrobiota bacterium]|nr:PorV/PorQ family protein [Elusimicrobiota bacterium]
MKKLLSVLLVAALSSSVFGWEVDTGTEKGEAGGAAAYLKTGVGSRALAMGGAFTAVANDASAAYWNPAGIANLEKNQVALTYTAMSLDRTYNFLSFVMPKKLSVFDGIGVSVINAGVSDIQGYDATDTKTNTFKETNIALLLSVAKKVDDEVSVGANLKIISSKLDTAAAFGQGLDLSALVKASDKISIGLMLQDVYTQVKWADSESAERVPFSVRTGLSYSIMEKDKLKLTADVEKYATRKKAKLNFGAELNLPYSISLRPGLSDNYLTAGVGLKYDMLSLDYAYRADKLNSGDTSQVTLGFSF